MELNTTYGTGNTHEVVFINERGGAFTYFIGSQEECYEYIDDYESQLPDGTEVLTR